MEQVNPYECVEDLDARATAAGAFVGRAMAPVIDELTTAEQMRPYLLTGFDIFGPVFEFYEQPTKRRLCDAFRNAVRSTIEELTS